MDKAQGLQLRDIHMPADPGFWPLAPGWWLLIILALIGVYLLLKKLKHMRHKKHLIGLLQKQLQQLREDYNKHNNKHTLAIQISDLLKRFVRHILDDSNATALSGEAWLNYLNSRVGGDVFNEFEEELTQAQYRPDLDYDVSKLIAVVKNYFPTAIHAHNKKVNEANTRSNKHA